jgi:hypothetical protein
VDKVQLRLKSSMKAKELLFSSSSAEAWCSSSTSIPTSIFIFSNAWFILSIVSNEWNVVVGSVTLRNE